MLYEKCLKCEKLGKACNCMSFVKLTSREIIEWCKAKKSLLGLTNEKLADVSGVPVGTINRIFAGKGTDYYYETLRPIIKALVSGEWSEDNCPNIQESEETQKYSKDIISRLEAEKDFLKQENKYLQDKAEKETSILTSLLQFRKNIIIILSVLFGIALAVIITALIIDSQVPDRGFIWMPK